MACKTAQRHCEMCGSTDYEDTDLGDQGYSACCNELVVDGSYCDGGHEDEIVAQAEIDAAMAARGFTGCDARDRFIDSFGQAAFDAIADPIFERAYRS